MALTLYRRHLRACAKGYPQNARVTEPTTRLSRSKDCECPIAAEGTLKSGFITNKSTFRTDWNAARTQVRQWETWGQITEPKAEPEAEIRTVEYAVESFLQSYGPTGKNLESSTLNGFRVLLHQRLIPFCEKRQIRYIRDFDDYDLVSKFVESWRNLQPTRNRKNAGPVLVDVPLQDSTRKTEIERFRSFSAYCLKREWLTANHAREMKFVIDPVNKYGLSPEEEERFFAACTSTLHTFCQVLRFAGLRLSDATVLHDRQLVPRAGGDGWAIVVESQEKTKTPVYIPIPDELYKALLRQPVMGSKDGRNYWFWTTTSTLKSQKNNWYERIINIRNHITVEFRNGLSPHTFRHTFSISHLNAGTDIKFVSRWLGHKSIRTTEKHYGHAIHATKVASELAYDQSLTQQQVLNARLRRMAMALSA